MAPSPKSPIVAFGPNDTEKTSYFIYFPGEDPRSVKKCLMLLLALRSLFHRDNWLRLPYSAFGLHPNLAERMGGSQGPSKKRAEYPHYVALGREEVYVAGYSRRGDIESESCQITKSIPIGRRCCLFFFFRVFQWWAKTSSLTIDHCIIGLKRTTRPGNFQRLGLPWARMVASGLVQTLAIDGITFHLAWRRSCRGNSIRKDREGIFPPVQHLGKTMLGF
jgi:hypothetical protein